MAAPSPPVETYGTRSRTPDARVSTTQLKRNKKKKYNSRHRRRRPAYHELSEARTALLLASEGVLVLNVSINTKAPKTPTVTPCLPLTLASAPSDVTVP